MNEELKAWLKSQIKRAKENEAEELKDRDYTLANLWAEDQKIHKAVLNKVRRLDKK